MYDFDQLLNRRGSHSVKWDEPEQEGVIPMWVADMDFMAAPAIQEALRKRVEHGVFGYTLVPDAYYDAIVNWFGRYHHWTIDRQDIIYTTGVVPAISCAIQALTMGGENVLIQTPVYNCFFSSIRNSGSNIVENPLKRQGDTYVIDFDDFERKCADEKTTAFLLCNPHNPAGRVWTKEELTRMNDICMRHHVRVIADEIHCELVMPGYTFTPFASISEACRDNSVTLNSPSKSFNIAGLQIANIICHDPAMRRRINRQVNINEVCDVNPFGVEALMAAYNDSRDWLVALNDYLWENYQALCRFCEEQLPQWKVLKLEGTYLPWVDITATGMTSDALADLLLSEAKVMVNSGTMYGAQTGEGYIRLNIACPRARMLEGLERIKKVFIK
jgi:cystathionine beta-lyase